MPERDYILVVDDEAIIREMVVESLRRAGFDADAAADGAALRRLIALRMPAVVIVDLRLPGEDGFAITRHLRENTDCGLIMLTSTSETTDVIVALEIGADHFVTKPADQRELLARVRSLIRRGRSTRAPEPDTGPGWRFDRTARCVIGPSGASAELSGAEYSLLAELVDNPGRVCSREHLLQVVYDRPWDYFDRSVDVLVARLRRKLEDAGITTEQIRSVRGVGYTFTRRIADKARMGEQDGPAA